MRFDTLDARLFVAIAEHGVLSRGARTVHLSVAAASERVKALEERVGKTLFYRASNGLALTLAGESFLRHARLILSQLALALEDLAQLDDESAGHIRIFANTSAVTEFMPQILGAFMSSWPRVTVDLIERSLRDVIRGVSDGTVDFGIVAGASIPQPLQSIHFSTDRMVVVAPPRHPLGKQRPIAFEQTLSYAQVGLHESTSWGIFMREVTQPLARAPVTRIQLRSFEAMCSMVSAGVGLAVVPESAARRYREQMPLRVYPLTDAWAVRERRIVARDLQALPASSRALMDEIRGYFSRRDSGTPATPGRRSPPGPAAMRRGPRSDDPKTGFQKA